MTSTEICNMALSHLGISKEIANVETESSAEAAACRRFFDNTVDIMLADSAWPFATRFFDLELVEEDPTDEWAFSYRYPAGVLYLRRVLSGIRQDYQGSRIEYKIGSDDNGLLIFCDEEDPQIEYTYDPDGDTTLFPADFCEAMSYRLAASIAPRVTGGDPFKLGEAALQKYERAIASARANAANEEQPGVAVESEFIRER